MSYNLEVYTSDGNIVYAGAYRFPKLLFNTVTENSSGSWIYYDSRITGDGRTIAKMPSIKWTSPTEFSFTLNSYTITCYDGYLEVVNDVIGYSNILSGKDIAVYKL